MQLLKNLARSLLVNLATLLITIPILAACILLTSTLVFWVSSQTGHTLTNTVSHRTLLGIFFLGNIGSLLVTGFAIYHIQRLLASRVRKSPPEPEKR